MGVISQLRTRRSMAPGFTAITLYVAFTAFVYEAIVLHSMPGFRSSVFPCFYYC